jgi:hypothetical protein
MFMRVETFLLERYLAEHKATGLCKYNLASGSIYPMRFRDLIGIDPDMEIGYGTTGGSDDIKKEISLLYSKVDKDNLLVTTSASEANLLASLSLLDKGDEVVAPIPTYMQISGLARAIGAKVKEPKLNEEQDFKLDIHELNEMVSSKTKLIFIANPNNPTGKRFCEKEVRAICEVAKDVDACVLSDEILRGSEIDGVLATPVVDLYDKGISTGGLSKIGLAGLRLGWIAGDKKIIEECKRYRDYTTLTNSPITEYLAIAAMRKENMTKILGRCKNIVTEHSKILSDWIDEHRDIFSWVPPEATSVAFPRHNLKINSNELCERLLKESGVLVGPGEMFGFPKNIRIGFGCRKETLAQGLNIFDGFLKEHAFRARATDAWNQRN